jgi:hypothetical protein
MADNPVTPRGRAANPSRRASVRRIASRPVRNSRSGIPDPARWEAAFKAYAAAHYAHEAFLANTLQPVYRQYNADLARLHPTEPSSEIRIDVRKLRTRVDAAEDKIREVGGDRADVLWYRRANPEHTNDRISLALDLRSCRTRRRLMHKHNILALEKQGSDLAAVRQDALQKLLRTPALDRAGMLLKIRLGYEGVFRHDDYGGWVASFDLRGCRAVQRLA